MAFSLKGWELVIGKHSEPWLLASLIWGAMRLVILLEGREVRAPRPAPHNHHSNRADGIVVRQRITVFSHYCCIDGEDEMGKRQQPSISTNWVIDGCNFLFRDRLYASLVLKVPSMQVLAGCIDGGGVLFHCTWNSQIRSKVVNNFTMNFNLKL